MSSTPRITIDIAPDGSVTVKPEGYVGRTCKDATAALEKALGLVTDDTPTREMHQTTSTPTRINTR